QMVAFKAANSTPAQSIKIGEPNILSNYDDGNANLLIAQYATLGQTAIVQSLSFYVTTAAGSPRLGIYDANGPNGGSGPQKAATSAFVPTVGWTTANVTMPVPLSPGAYWLAYLPTNNALAFRKAPVASGVPASRFYSYSFGTMPATFATTGVSTTTSHWSLYATLSASSSSSTTSTSSSASSSSSTAASSSASTTASSSASSSSSSGGVGGSGGTGGVGGTG